MGGWHKASVSDCLPLAAPIGLSPLHIPNPCGSERVLVGGGGGASPALRQPRTACGGLLQGGGGGAPSHIRGGKFRGAPWIDTLNQSPQCAPLVCEKFAVNPEFRSGDFAVN